MPFLLPYKPDHEDYTLSKWDCQQPSPLQAVHGGSCQPCHTFINLATKDTMSPNRLRQFIIVSRADSLNFMLYSSPGFPGPGANDVSQTHCAYSGSVPQQIPKEISWDYYI